MQMTRNSSAANAAPSRNIHIFFIAHSPLAVFTFSCLSIITSPLDSLHVLLHRKKIFSAVFTFPVSHNAKTALASITETGAVHLLYLCFFRCSRNHLRGFLIAACSALYKRRVQEAAYLRYLFFRIFDFLSFS